MGYPAKKRHPAYTAALAQASFPCKTSFRVFLCVSIFTIPFSDSTPSQLNPYYCVAVYTNMNCGGILAIYCSIISCYSSNPRFSTIMLYSGKHIRIKNDFCIIVFFLYFFVVFFPVLFCCILKAGSFYHCLLFCEQNLANYRFSFYNAANIVLLRYF